MKRILVLLSYFISLILSGQEVSATKEADPVSIAIVNWLSELTEVGIETSGNNLKISKESQKVLDNPAYRATIYPKEYTWDHTLKALQDQDLRKAFWFFINMYPKSSSNKDIILKSVLSYDKLFNMDKVLIATFYTYCFMDPEVSVIIDGKPEIVRPDILETKQRSVKEITAYINWYRKQNDSINSERKN